MSRGRWLAGSVVWLTVAWLVLGLLAGCGQQQLRDVKDAPVTDPDKVRLVVNVDDFANVVALCIEGAGFASTTRDYNALVRVEAWDAASGGWCAPDGAR